MEKIPLISFTTYFSKGKKRCCLITLVSRIFLSPFLQKKNGTNNLTNFLPFLEKKRFALISGHVHFTIFFIPFSKILGTMILLFCLRNKDSHLSHESFSNFFQSVSLSAVYPQSVSSLSV